MHGQTSIKCEINQRAPIQTHTELDISCNYILTEQPFVNEMTAGAGLGHDSSISLTSL